MHAAAAIAVLGFGFYTVLIARVRESVRGARRFINTYSSV